MHFEQRLGLEPIEFAGHGLAMRADASGDDVVRRRRFDDHLVTVALAGVGEAQ